MDLAKNPNLENLQKMIRSDFSAFTKFFELSLKIFKMKTNSHGQGQGQPKIRTTTLI